MSAYKKLNKQDAYITTYAAHKPWVITGTDFQSYGITTPLAGDGYVFENLQQLYYKTKNSDGSIPSHSFDNYDQTTLYYSSSRDLTLGSQVISIPRQLYGTAIEPRSFRVSFDQPDVIVIGPVEQGVLKEGYVKDSPTIYVTDSAGARAPIQGGGGVRPIVDGYVFVDDGEGNLYLDGSPNVKVGDIIYTHGMAIITNQAYLGIAAAVISGFPAGVVVSFKSTQPIFTHNYHCRIRESEYNYTYNPTALTSSLKTVYDNSGNIYSTSSAVANGVLNNKVTGSAFQPYITTVGLYNDTNELIAVGKMTRPIPKSANTEMTIIVKIDI